MKRQHIYKMSAAALIAGALVNTACSDDFLEEKKLYGKYSEATVYANYETAKNRIDYIMWQLLPGKKEGDGKYSLIVSVGGNDDQGCSTEEYGGISAWENNLKLLDYQSLNGWEEHFYVEFKENSPYGNIRNINDCIHGLETYGGSLDKDDYNHLLGQAYFWRAWRYYTMVRWYGGVPIITEVQNAVLGDGQGESLIVPRASTKECIDFICSDLDKAAELLPLAWDNPTKDWGRVTAGTARALKGRLLLLFASPLFNRADRADRWEAAYQANKAALDTLDMGGYGLAYENNPGSEKTSGANWGKIFLNTQGSDGNVNEAVFVTLYNNIEDTEGNTKQWNSWEQGIRPKTASGGGGKAATSEIVDLFPMADGKKPDESAYDYDKILFFQNRDPRFYRTFAFPGVKWTYQGQTKDLLTESSKDLVYPKITLKDDYPYNGDQYVLWSYTWYNDQSQMGEASKSGWAADALGSKNFSVYVRKRCDDLELNSSPMYVYQNNSGACSFSQSGAPFMEMRYAEVLLNYAEAAAATNRYDEALAALKRIRSRVYNPADNDKIDADYGLTLGDRAHMLAEVLYERQIELAYEGKRFDDMRRWMLFDGGEGQGSLCASWALTGFGGNTCTYLGVSPANGVKHHYIEMYTNRVAAKAEDNGSDPILAEGITRPGGLNLMDRFKSGTNGEQALIDFYTAYLTRKDRNADGNNTEQIPTFQPYYYFLGLGYSAMYNNATLYQTIGWEDYSHGGDGIYDPLEEDPTKIPVDKSYENQTN